MDEMQGNFVQVQNQADMSTITQSMTETPTTSTEDTGSVIPTWMGLQACFAESNDWGISSDVLYKGILLDNQSVKHLVCNPKLVENVAKSKNILVVNTNAGDMEVNQETDLSGPRQRGAGRRQVGCGRLSIATRHHDQLAVRHEVRIGAPCAGVGTSR